MIKMDFLHPFEIVSRRKPIVRHFRFFGYPAIFKGHDIRGEGKRLQNKYL